MDWWSRDCKTQSGTVHRKYTGLPMRIDRNENYFALLHIICQVTIPYFGLQFRWNSRCFDVLKSRARHKVWYRACVRIPMYSGLKTKDTAVIHRKYPSSDVNTINRIIDYWSKCSLMIYGKTNVQLTHCGREDLWKWTIFNTILTSQKSWLSQEDLDAGCEHSLVPMDS